MKIRAMLGVSACLIVLAGCSSGGGGGSGATTGTTASNTGSTSTNTSSTNTNTSSTSTATVTIAAAGAISAGGANPTQATGTTPNFMSNPPPSSTPFAVTQTAVSVSSTSVADANAGGGTVTFTPGTATQSGQGLPTVELKIPSIGLDLPNLAGSTTSPLATGNFNAINNLNYTLYGVWTTTSKTNPNGFSGALVTGFQTPAANVPTSGTGTYQGQFSGSAGSVSGIVYAPSGNGTVASSAIVGAAQITVDFLAHTVGGGLTGMESANGSWNSVSFSGTLSGSGISGTTTATGQTGDPVFGMQTSANGTPATGTFGGALYGPNAQELGAVWTLHDSTGKTAIGTVGASVVTGTP